MIRSPTIESTILPKAAPMITPTARSMTLPLIANSLNSLAKLMLLLLVGWSVRGHAAAMAAGSIASGPPLSMRPGPGREALDALR